MNPAAAVSEKDQSSPTEAEISGLSMPRLPSEGYANRDLPLETRLESLITFIEADIALASTPSESGDFTASQLEQIRLLCAERCAVEEEGINNIRVRDLQADLAEAHRLPKAIVIAKELASIPAESAVSALFKAFEDGELLKRTSIVNALASRKTARVVEFLCQRGLNDQNESVLRATIEALGKIGDHAAIEHLERELHRQHDESVWAKSLLAISKIDEETGLLRRKECFESSRARKRKAALMASKEDKHPEVITFVRDLCEDDSDRNNRKLAASIMRSLRKDASEHILPTRPPIGPPT